VQEQQFQSARTAVSERLPLSYVSLYFSRNAREENFFNNWVIRVSGCWALNYRVAWLLPIPLNSSSSFGDG